MQQVNVGQLWHSRTGVPVRVIMVDANTISYQRESLFEGFITQHCAAKSWHEAFEFIDEHCDPSALKKDRILPLGKPCATTHCDWFVNLFNKKRE